MTALRAFLVFDAAWLASLFVLAANGRSISEPLVLAAILGVALPALALLVCRGLPRREATLPVAREATLLAGLVLFVAAFLAWKGPLLAALLPAAPDPRLEESVNTLLKLVAFVAIPLFLYARLTGLAPRALGLAWPPGEARARRRSWLAFVALGAAMVAIQLTLGRNARPLVDGSLAGHRVTLGFLLSFVWLSIEAGLVEETFFRVILQSRLAALTGSQGAGLWLSALVFGAAHAPGLWLRGAGAMEGMTTPPSLALSLAYCVTTMGVAGLVFGVLWLRTRNWLLLVALHGFTDALSNAVGFMETWGL